MYNADGSIKYDKIENGTRVWVLEELEDGSYGKYALIENAQNLNDDQIREAAKTATSKFSKAEVDAKGGFKPTDSVVVYETNTYAARKQISTQYGKDFYYELTANSSKFYKSYIDEIYNVGLDGLEKQGEKYYYKGKEVVTLEDFKTITRQREDARDLYPTDESNKHYLESFGTYVVATTYYDVLSDFLIAHPESPIFAGNYDKVFWGGDEAYYFKVAFAARLMNDAFKSKYGLNIDTPNFSNKPIDSKAEGDRPIEKVTYSFVRTDLKGDADSFASSLYNDDDDLWKHEIGLSYSSENVERVRKWVKGLDSMLGNVATDPFSDKPTSEITKQEYIDVVFNKVYNFYLSTYKDQLTPEQIEELRAKFGDSVFNIVGDRVEFDDTLESGAGYLLQGNGSRVFRNSLGVVTENTEIFTYHDVITPLRAYRLKADENTVRHVYEKVKRGSVIATHKDVEGNELIPQESIKTNDFDGEEYVTSSKEIPVKVVTDTTPEGFTRTTTITYQLVENPANKDGNVIGGETITVPYVYRPITDIRINGSVIATYTTEDGEKLTDDINVKTDAPERETYSTVVKEFDSKVETSDVNGLTKTVTTRYELVEIPANQNGNVVGNQTITVPYVYRKVVTVDIKGSVIATYKDEEGNILASEEKVITNQNAGTYYAAAAKQIQASASSKVTENGREVTLITYELIKTPDNETGDVVGGETLVVPYVYRKVENVRLVPNEPPVVEDEVLKVTRFHTDQGEELQSDVAGFEDAPSIIGDYQFTGTTETNEAGDVQTHIYTKIVTEIPDEAPTHEVPEAKVTRYQTEDGTDIKDSEEGFIDALNMIGKYQFTGVTETNEAGDVQTHIYKSIETEVPGDVPQVDIPELRLTRHIDEKGNELAPIEEGSNGPRKTIGDYEYTGRTDVEGGVTTHVYAPIRYEIPGEAPQYDIPELKVTRHVDESGKELIETEKGSQPSRKTINNYEYTGRTTEQNDVTTHVYARIKHEIPGDAPIVDIPDLKVTRYVNENGEEIKDSETGFIDAPKMIGDYEFTDKTEFNDGKDVQTHIYKLLTKPITPEIPESKKPELPRTPEPKKPDTPRPETPKPTETPKSNDSQTVVVKSSEQSRFVTNELPKTGETNSKLALVGVSLLTALGMIGLVKRKREN